ncbi:hypothetical protein ACFL35_15305 [Candidatus Riflebacteria bacterium]
MNIFSSQCKRLLFVFCFCIFFQDSITAQNPFRRFFGGPPRGRRQRYNKSVPIIDVHCHFIPKAKRRRRMYIDDECIQSALKDMNRYGIKRVFLMPPPFPHWHKRKYTVDLLLPFIRKYPGRFALVGGGGSLHSLISEADEKGKVTARIKEKFIATAKNLVKKGIVGFGEFALEHLGLGPDHHYQRIIPDHPLFLLLADLAAEYNLPIDVHFEVITKKISCPDHLKSPPNPETITANFSNFERLLSHNAKANFIWSHVGWCNTGFKTIGLLRYCLKKYPNLYLSFKISPRDSVAENMPVEIGYGLKDEWRELLLDYPDSFMLGCDQFLKTSGSRNRGPKSLEPTYRFFGLLPANLAKKIGYQNAMRLFNLK